MMRKIFFVLLNIIVIGEVCGQIVKHNQQTTQSQTVQHSGSIIDDKKFEAQLLNSEILQAINNERQKNNLQFLDTNIVLNNSSLDYAQYLSTIDDAKSGLGGKKQSLSFRLQKYGGANQSCFEFSIKANLKKGKDAYSYSELAQDIVFKWYNSKIAEELNSERYVMIGIASCTDVDHKKVFVNIILGNYSTLNPGSKSTVSFTPAITLKNQGLKPYDEKICKNCEKFKNIDTLQAGLSVENNVIYLETNPKFLKRVLKNPDDGIAVDVVYKSQYTCGSENVVNKILPSKGLMLKKITQEKLLSLNQITGKESKTKFRAPVGELPSNNSDYELNLIVFCEKTFCKNVRPAYTELFQSDVKSRLKVIGDTISFYNDFEYKPTPDTTYLNFIIPFQLGKSEYNKEDIKPLIEALNEPDFIITNLKITSYSSIEGKEEKNEQLRIERAQNIVQAFKELQKGKTIDAEIVNSDAWKLFYNDIKGTTWDSLRKKSPDVIREFIAKNKMEQQMESILSRERFAKVEMRIIYDLGSIQKEQGFVLKKFHQALDSSDIVKALNIQKYIIKKVRRGQYSKYIIPQMHIPADSARFAGMQMNKLWLDYIINEKPIDSAFYVEVCRLSKLDPKNEYIIYNRLFCEIKLFDLVDEAYVSIMQQKVDALRTSRLRKSDVDPLTIELQVKIIESIGNTLKVNDEQRLLQETLNRIKSIFDLNTGEWKRALNLAGLFIQVGDYEYPVQLLEPYIYQQSVDEKVIFTYLSACSHIDYKFQTQAFELALKKALTVNKSKTCDLFRNRRLSFQMFENPQIKSKVCEQCGL